MQNFPGMLPYKRPAQDKQPGISIYQPSAAAYQQLMQLQQQPSFVPVSCEYTSNQSHASANTIYPNTSTAIPNNNLHHHLILNSQTSINNSSNENNNNLKLAHNNNNNINSNASNVYNNTVTSTANAIVAAVAAQNKIATAQQQFTANAAANILSTSPSKSINNNAVIDDETSVTIVQAQAKLINAGNGTDDDLNHNQLNDNNTLETKPEISLLNNDHIDDETTSLSIDKTISNAIGMTASLAANSTTAVSMLNAATNVTTAAAVANTINNNINNNILSRKNATPNQPHLLNHNISSNNNINNISSKVINPANKMQDNMQELMSVSQLNNSQAAQAAAQAALLSAVLNNQPYHQQQLGMPQTHSLYADPAQIAKEVAQKNYANALKMAVAQQNSHMAGKPLTAMSYSGMTLNNTPSMYPQQPGSSHPRMPTAIAPSRAPMHFSAMQRPMQNPYQQYIRPQMTPVNMQAANQYYAAAAHQQFLNQQNFLYSGLAHGAMNPQLAVTSTASQPTHMTSAYPYAYSQAQAMNAQGMPTSMMQVPQMTVPPSAQTQGNGSAVVLNPYKKMKTS